jgi:hypothetical protein
MIAGTTFRFIPLDLPALILNYGGSMIWALMISWIGSARLPSEPQL